MEIEWSFCWTQQCIFNYGTNFCEGVGILFFAHFGHTVFWQVQKILMVEFYK